ncbi:MAG: uncharacterized protein A8A55_2810 [Amphiamblys sp. WSBS2006]|nr:MAG: uncharacterized protein A8A55_2810 [Amphiamblys sp. WSBS2006]
MESETTKTLKIGKIFFFCTHQNLFLVPENEHERIRQTEEGYVYLESKYLSELTDRDMERVICIVCHGEAAPEDIVSPLCRQMHFVICKECIEYLDKRKYKREVFCPFCKDKKRDNKAYQEEILDAVLSLMTQQTFHSLEIRPDMEVKIIKRLPRENKVFLSSVCVSDSLFFKLLSITAVEITNSISIYLWPRQLS